MRVELLRLDDRSSGIPSQLRAKEPKAREMATVWG